MNYQFEKGYLDDVLNILKEVYNLRNSLTSNIKSTKYEELGSFFQPYFQIRLNATIDNNKFEKKHEVLEYIIDKGLLPTFIHELVHFYQFTTTVEGFSIMQFYNAILHSISMISKLVKTYARDITPSNMYPPFYKWIQEVKFNDIDAQIEQEEILEYIKYYLSRTLRKKGGFSREESKDGLKYFYRQVEYEVEHIKSSKAGWNVFKGCEFRWQLNSSGYIFKLGSENVLEGMAKAIETFVECESDSNKALNKLVADTLNLVNNINDFESLKYYVTYYHLFLCFIINMKQAKEKRHFTIETFVALCEIALCWATGSASTSFLFINYTETLCNNSENIPILDIDNQLPFFSAFCSIRNLDLDYYHNYLLTGFTKILNKEINSFFLTPLILESQPIYKKLAELRSTSRSEPFIFLNFLSKEKVALFLNEYLDGIPLLFRDKYFSFRKSESSLSGYVEIITIMDSLFNALFGEKGFECILKKKGLEDLCEFETICDSTWPKSTCDYDHPCSAMTWFKYLWNLIYGDDKEVKYEFRI